jgi:hypothetical protein
LEEIEYISMLDESASWKPVLELENLKTVINSGCCDIIEELKIKGVKLI